VGVGWTSKLIFSGSILRWEGPELEATVAHELGHLKARDPWRIAIVRFLFLSLTVGVGLWLIDMVLPTVSLPRVDPAARDILGIIHGTREIVLIPSPAWVPVLLAIWQTARVLTLPLYMAFSRRREAAADIYGVELTRDPRAAVESLRRGYARGSIDLDQGPIARLFFSTHGTPQERISRILSMSAPPTAID
jgi:Zn-dependent protease with chaperone function